MAAGSGKAPSPGSATSAAGIRQVPDQLVLTGSPVFTKTPEKGEPAQDPPASARDQRRLLGKPRAERGNRRRRVPFGRHPTRRPAQDLGRVGARKPGPGNGEYLWVRLAHSDRAP